MAKPGPHIYNREIICQEVHGVAKILDVSEGKAKS